MQRHARADIYTYLIFLVIAVLGIFYGNLITGRYPDLRVWGINNILLMLAGLPFLLLQQKAGIPGFWQSEISNKKRFLIPFITGIVFGVFDVVVFKIILHPEPYTELPPFLQPFPYSIFLYFSGAFETEVFYRLIPLTIFCLLGKWYNNGKYYNHLFLVAAILTSLREPLEQLQTGAVWLITYSLLTGFLMNFLQSVFFRTTGFIGSLVVRLGHYLLWHILLGIYVQYFEL